MKDSRRRKMISAWWLLLLFPVGWFMFFLGVVMCRNSWDDERLDYFISSNEQEARELIKKIDDRINTGMGIDTTDANGGA